MSDALGLLEVAGLVAAVSAGDAMVKSANVQILGIEKAKGHAWMTVKITGDVGAVTAAIESGAAMAETLHSLVSQKVIPRPTKGLIDCFVDDYRPQQGHLDEKAIEVLDEIVSKIVEPEAPKKATHKRSPKKK